MGSAQMMREHLAPRHPCRHHRHLRSRGTPVPPEDEGRIDVVTSEKENLMEHWEYYVANVELKEIEGRYTWVCSIGRETIVGLPALLKRFGMAGWELINLIPLRQTTVPGEPAVIQVEILMATFKRRLGSSDDSPSDQQLAPEIKPAGEGAE